LAHSQPQGWISSLDCIVRCTEDVRLTSQYFSPVTQLSDSFSSEPEDGIMGMAYPSISNIKVRHTIAASARVFGFHLAKVRISADAHIRIS
jgi:hypothetical protein